MAHYIVIYGLLMLATWMELLVIGLNVTAQVIVTSIIGLAAMKAVLIALFYQHLRYEQKSVSGLAMLGLGGVVTFMLISLYSILGVSLV